MHSVCIRVAEKSGFQLLEFNGEADRAHLLIEHSPATPVSQLVSQVKGVTSRVLRKEFGFQGEQPLQSQLLCLQRRRGEY